MLFVELLPILNSQNKSSTATVLGTAVILSTAVTLKHLKLLSAAVIFDNVQCVCLFVRVFVCVCVQIVILHVFMLVVIMLNV